MKKLSFISFALIVMALILSPAAARAETLIADFASGSVEPNLKKLPHKSKQAGSPEELAKALSDWTGLDFKVKISEKDGAFIVDWAADSTLIANLDDRQQKEEFHFFDAESMRWFMMDSLWRTLGENFHKEVYYTMNGGQELTFDELSPINVFPLEVPYMGSPFYFAHSDGRGDMADE